MSKDILKKDLLKVRGKHFKTKEVTQDPNKDLRMKIIIDPEASLEEIIKAAKDAANSIDNLIKKSYE